MKKRIAQIGTFDVENFGDLLFPTILDYYMEDYEIDIFSLNGNCIKPFEEEQFVYPLSALEKMCKENQYAAILIGGGDIVLCDVAESSVYVWESSLLFKLWALPIMIGNRYNIPVIFNAPGVPFRFNKSMHGMVRELLGVTESVVVRDNCSADFLLECGVQNVKVIPDTVLTISKVYSNESMKALRNKLREKINLPTDDDYIVVQHNTFGIDDEKYLECFLSLLDRITEKGKKIVLLPIGYVHNDGAFLEKVYSSDKKNQYMITGKLTPQEMCAVLAGSEGYVGSSMHGAVVSYSYGKFAICINTKGYAKTKGLLEQIHHPEWEVQYISDLPERFDEVFEKKVDFDSTIVQTIEKHFSAIKEIMDKGKVYKEIPDVLQEYFNAEKSINDSPDKDFTTAKIYFDFGQGFFSENAKTVLYQKTDEGELTFELEIPKGVRKIRIDPIENAIIAVDFLKIMVDGKETHPSVENMLAVDDKNVIVNTDPCFTIDSDNMNKLEFNIRARIINLFEMQELIGKLNFEKQIEIQVVQEALEGTKSQFEAASQEVETLEELVEKTKSQFEAASQEVETLEKLLEKKEKEYKSREDKYKKRVAEYKRKQKEFSVVQKESLNNINSLNAQVDSLNSLNLGLRNQLSEKENEVERIKSSFCWKLTFPIRKIGDTAYRLMQKTYVTQCALEALKILFTKGPKEVCISCGRFIERTYNSKEAENIAPGKSANNRDGYSPYDSEYQENRVFEGTPDVKMLAFYLPQYHSFPENDEWWGKGFTEWVNVKNGDARFEGHYQPRVPHEDIGYYNLEDVSVLAKQAKLAKEHGVYGFCFYYYWFSGKRLMEKPVDMLLQHPEIDLPFCLCWANENWTRAWDGMNKNILIAQEYSDEDDEQFILDLEKYIKDSRYIKINGKPLIMVYNPGQIPDCHKSFAKWRECARRIGLGEILIWTCQTANNTAELLNITDCIDAEVEFPPHNKWLDSIAVRDLDLKGKSAFIFNYQCLVDYEVEKLKNSEKTAVPLHHGCMLAWDNAARRKDAWFTYYGFSLHSLYKWVLAISRRARKDFSKEERFVFVNAWNEWGEGTYLEPDEKYGYANINTVSKALYEIPFQDDIHFIDETSSKKEPSEMDRKIAVQVHMFYVETLEETIQNLNCIPYDFDCFVTTDCDEKKRIIEKAFQEKCRCKQLQVTVLENRGRDVAPFIVQMSPVIEKYDYICHIHSKKTNTGEYGNEWRRYIFRHLFGCKGYLKSMFDLLEKNPDIGIVMPETFPVLELQAEWGGNLEGVKELLRRIGCFAVDLPQDPIFPVGNMFWARTDAIMPMFTNDITQVDFPEEQGQTNATIAHQIERSWVYIAADRGYTYRKVFNNYSYHGECKEKKRLGIFVHFDARNVVPDTDIETLKEYSKIIQDIVFVTNSKLPEEEINKVATLVSKVMKRENKGLDFGAWRDVLLAEGRHTIEKYDELILFNNSCYAPLFEVKEVFAKMESRGVDFWGNTIFPYSPDGSYIHRDCIPEHLQSYFTVYEKKVLGSDTFWEFWETMPDYENYIDVVANCETQFTKILSDASFTYAPYILESYYICQYLQNYSVPYEKPSSLVLLRDPFVKKKCLEHMSEEERVKLQFLMKSIKNCEKFAL